MKRRFSILYVFISRGIILRIDVYLDIFPVRLVRRQEKYTGVLIQQQELAGAFRPF